MDEILENDPPLDEADGANELDRLPDALKLQDDGMSLAAELEGKWYS